MSSSRSRNVRSPGRKEALNQELNEHTQRVRELMVADLTMLQEENQMLKSKCQRVSELQQKVELVLRNNDELFTQNHKLAALVEQKITECQLLRQKVDSRRNYDSANEYEKVKLHTEIEELRKQIDEVEAIKSLTIKEIRTKHMIELDNIIKENEAGMKLYDQELIKIKAQLDQKQDLLEKAQQQIKQLNKKKESQVEELQKEINEFKDGKKQLEGNFDRLQEEKNKLDEVVQKVKSQKRQVQEKHQDSIKDLQGQLMRLKHNYEQTVQKFEEEKKNDKKESQKISQEKDDQIMKLKKENDGLKLQIKDNDYLNEKEVAELREKLEQLHTAEITEINMNHRSHQDYLENQVLKLEDLLKSKDTEIALLLEQKTTMKQLFMEEANEMKADLQMLQGDFKTTQMKKHEVIEKMHQELLEAEAKYKNMKLQCEKKQDQLNQVRYSLSQQKNEQNIMIKKFEEAEKKLKETINDWKESYFNSQASLEKEKQEWNSHKRALMEEKAQIIRKYEEQLELRRKEYEKIERQNDSFKEFIGNRDRGIDQLLDKVTELSQKLDQRESMIDEQREEIIEITRRNGEKMGEQRASLERSFQDQMRYMKEDYQTRNTILQTNLDIALKELKSKEIQLEELLRQYDKMRRQMIALTEQQASKKDLTLKFAGATADLIATKNLFDVFVKGKVLETCQDVLTETENQPPS